MRGTTMLLTYCHVCGKYIDGYTLEIIPGSVEWGMCEACADEMAQAHYQEFLLNEGTHSTEHYDNTEEHSND